MYIYEGCTIEEVQAMRDLQNEPFDFGTGLIDNSNGGEEAYYEMALECGMSDNEASFYDREFFKEAMERISLNIEFNSCKKDKSRASRRKNNWKKAIGKRRYGYMHLYDKPLNALNKGKNFCSCSLCTPKTNPKGKKYFGSQKIKYKSRNWKHSDKKKIEFCKSSLKEYKNSESFNYWKWYWMDDAVLETKRQLREEDLTYYNQWLDAEESYKQECIQWEKEYLENEEWFDGLD